MALIKIIFKNLLLSLGYSFRKIQKNKNLKYIIEENSRTPRVKPQILEAIFNFHEKINRPKSLMDKKDLLVKKRENNYLQEIFYKDSKKRGLY